MTGEVPQQSVSVSDRRAEKQMPAITHRDQSVEQVSLGVIQSDAAGGKYRRDIHFIGIISPDECPAEGIISTNCIDGRYLNLRVKHSEYTEWYILSPEYKYRVNEQTIKHGIMGIQYS